MGLDDRIRRLQKLSNEQSINITQKDGTVKKFPPKALKDAFLNTAARMEEGEVPLHPLNEAADNAAHGHWANSFFGTLTVSDGRDPGEVPDLSE